MRRKSLGITICTALLLVALAAPATAGGGREAPQATARAGLVQAVLDWLADLVPGVPEVPGGPAELQSRPEAVEADGTGDDTAGTEVSDCISCLTTQRAKVVDADG